MAAGIGWFFLIRLLHGFADDIAVDGKAGMILVCINSGEVKIQKKHSIRFSLILRVTMEFLHAGSIFLRLAGRSITAHKGALH